MRKVGWTVMRPMALLLIMPLPLWGGSAERVNVEIILDASGSMAAKMDGRRKIDIAKEVLMTSLVGKIPANAQVAVRAYGHHRKEDCNDLELLTPFGPKQSARIRQKVQALKPVGRTPIAGSLEAAGKDFAGREGQRNIIILVSDGQETCEGDTCAVARSLHQAGIQLEINVIGFDVAAEERQQLVCIADAGGGKYYDAPNAKEFKAIPEKIAKDEKWQVAKPQLAAGSATPSPQIKKINLLHPKNGGHVVVVSDNSWLRTIDGKYSSSTPSVGRVGAEAIFGFKGEQPATFDTFAVLIPGTGNNLKAFELLVADKSIDGPFRSIGKFETRNAMLIANKGWQHFKFTGEAVKYLKVKLLSGHQSTFVELYGFALLGPLQQ